MTVHLPCSPYPWQSYLTYSFKRMLTKSHETCSINKYGLNFDNTTIRPLVMFTLMYSQSPTNAFTRKTLTSRKTLVASGTYKTPGWCCSAPWIFNSHILLHLQRSSAPTNPALRTESTLCFPRCSFIYNSSLFVPGFVERQQTFGIYNRYKTQT